MSAYWLGRSQAAGVSAASIASWRLRVSVRDWSTSIRTSCAIRAGSNRCWGPISSEPHRTIRWCALSLRLEWWVLMPTRRLIDCTLRTRRAYSFIERNDVRLGTRCCGLGYLHVLAWQVSRTRGSSVAEIRQATDCDARAMGRNVELGRARLDVE
jgi:hypothetical protein